MMAAINLSMPETMKGITLDIVVTGQRQAAARLWTGAQLLKLGAWVMGCDIEISTTPTDAEAIRYQPIGGGPERVVTGRAARLIRSRNLL